LSTVLFSLNIGTGLHPAGNDNNGRRCTDPRAQPIPPAPIPLFPVRHTENHPFHPKLPIAVIVPRIIPIRQMQSL
jgi:hypothetical protein